MGTGFCTLADGSIGSAATEAACTTAGGTWTSYGNIAAYILAMKAVSGLLESKLTNVMSVTPSQALWWTELSTAVYDNPAGTPGARTVKSQTLVNDLKQTRMGYCTINGLTNDLYDKTSCQAAGGTWHEGLALASAVKQVAVTVNGQTAAIEQKFTTQETDIGGLKGQYTVKLDVSGRVAGFGIYNGGTSTKLS